MASCVIFCAGDFHGLAAPIGKEDLVIAADGGLRHTQSIGCRPQVILGDFDSLGYVPTGAQRHPVEKDDTDAMLAVRRGLDAGCRRFLLYGGMEGERVDHTLANLQTLQFLADRGARGYLIGARQIATVIREDSLSFPVGCSGTLSVFCMGEAAEGITLAGVKYPMENGTLTPGFPLGVSNRLLGGEARVAVKKGSLLIFYDRENGLV